MKPVPKPSTHGPQEKQERIVEVRGIAKSRRFAGEENIPSRNAPTRSLLTRYRSRSTTRPTSTSRKTEARGKIRRSVSEANLSTDNTSVANETEGEKHRISVGVRVRPLQSGEFGNTVHVRNKEVEVRCAFGSHSFFLDHAFGPKTPQEIVYNTMVRCLLDNAFQGYNCCLFTYGQTGSGKTYSMMGSEMEVDGIGSNTGMIPRFCHELMERVTRANNEPGGDALRPSKSSVVVSYVEIYNEKIRDLLVPPPSKNLKVREHPTGGPYVASLTKHSVTSYSDIERWLTVGNKQRIIAATEMNEKSSRSHSLFMVHLNQIFNQGKVEAGWNCEQTRRSQINLVDLAGSERIAHLASTSDRLRERVSINCSLMTLGKVISALVDKKTFVPYRESVLTWLLKESLGGNSRTGMLATVSPCCTHQDETLATLRYATQARTILNIARINEAPQTKILRELRLEKRRRFNIHIDTERNKPSTNQVNNRSKQHGNEESSKEIILLKAEIKTMQDLVEELKGKLAESEKTKKALKEREAQMERESLELKKSKECFDNLKMKFENFVNEHEKFFKMCMEKDQATEVLKKRTQRAQTKKTDAHDKLVASEKEVNRLSETIQRLLLEKAHLADKLQAMEKSVVEWKSDLEMRKRIEHGLRIRAESAEREIIMWHEKVAASIPEALQRITNAGSIEKDIEAYKTKINEIKHEAQSLSDALEVERTQKNFWKREFETCKLRLRTAETQLAHAEEELNTCKSKLEEKEVEMDEWVRINEEDMLRQLEEITCDLEVIKKEKENANKDP